MYTNVELPGCSALYSHRGFRALLLPCHLPLYAQQKGVFSAPAHGEIVVPDIEYVLTWDTALLKYFVDGNGIDLGHEKVSENVTIFLVGNVEDEGG